MKDKIDTFKNEANIIKKTIPLITIPGLLIISVYSKEVIMILYGEKWMAAADYLSILVFAGIFMIIDAITRNFIKSLGYVQSLFRATVIKRVVSCCIIAVAGCISVEYILYGYVFSAIIGIVFNCTLYAKLTNENAFSEILSLFSNTIIIVPLYIILIIIYNITSLLTIKILLTIGVIISYYYFYLPKIGINVLNILYKVIRR